VDTGDQTYQTYEIQKHPKAQEEIRMLGEKCSSKKKKHGKHDVKNFKTFFYITLGLWGPFVINNHHLHLKALLQEGPFPTTMDLD